MFVIYDKEQEKNRYFKLVNGNGVRLEKKTHSIAVRELQSIKTILGVVEGYSLESDFLDNVDEKIEFYKDCLHKLGLIVFFEECSSDEMMVL